jgi:hypothetical protein
MAHALGETAPLLMIGMVAFIVDIPGGFTDAATALPIQIYLWTDLPEIFSGPVTRRPSTTMVPRDGIFRPVASFMKVDLPQPDGPTMAMNSPGSARSVIASTA